MKSSPLLKLSRWWKAERKASTTADLMALATVDERGLPCVRTLFLKQIDAEGFHFVTQAMGPKAKQIADQNIVELCLNWPVKNVQVRVRGKAVRMGIAEIKSFWSKRERDAQILYSLGIAQSSEIPAYNFLQQEVAKKRNEWKDIKSIPYSPNYTGYIVKPSWIEILHHHSARLNKREKFTKRGKNWELTILAP